MKSIPEMLDLWAWISESRFTAVFAKLDTIKREVRALPRTLAEMLAARDKGSS